MILREFFSTRCFHLVGTRVSAIWNRHRSARAQSPLAPAPATNLPHAVRVIVDREFYEMHSDSVEFLTPGSPTFPDLEIYRR